MATIGQSDPSGNYVWTGSGWAVGPSVDLGFGLGQAGPTDPNAAAAVAIAGSYNPALYQTSAPASAAPAPAAPAPTPQPGTAPRPGAVAVAFPPGPHYAVVAARAYAVADANQGNSPEGWRVVNVVGLSMAYLDGTGAVRTGGGELLGWLAAGAPPSETPAPAPAPVGPTPGLPTPGPGDRGGGDLMPAPGGVDLAGVWSRYKTAILVGAGALLAVNSGLLAGGPRRRR